MTDQSFFTCLPTSSHDTSLMQTSGGGHSTGTNDHQFGAAASTKSDYDLKLATGSSSNNEVTRYGSSTDYHRNSSALQSALQTLQNFGNGTGQSTKDAQYSAPTTQNLTSSPVGLVMMARSTEDSDDDGYTPPKQSNGVSDNGGGVEASGDGDTFTSHPTNSGDGGGSGADPSIWGTGSPSTSSSSDVEYVPVHGHKIVTYHGYKAAVLSNGVFLLAPNGTDFATYTTPSGAFAPIKLADLDQDIQKDFSDILGSSPSEQDYENAYKTASNGGSPDQIRRDIAFSDAAAAKVNDLYAQVLGRGSDPGGLKAQQNALSSGMTLHDVRWSMAHSAEEVSHLNDLYRLELGRQADAGGSQNYQDAIGNGRSLDDSIHDIAYSTEARTQQIDPFLQNNIGNISGDLEQSAAAVLNYVSQAATSIRDYSQEQIQSLANGYQTSFTLDSNVVNSLTPHNWTAWQCLAAAVVVSFAAFGAPEMGAAAVVGGVAVAGGDALLDRASLIMESRFVTDLETKNPNIVTSEEKTYTAEDLAPVIAQHSLKHIDALTKPNAIPLRTIGINNLNDLSNYAKNMLLNAPSNPGRYEINSELGGDRIGIWDHQDQTVLIFNPYSKTVGDNNGTLFMPKSGYSYFKGLE
ncbi:hypothetical protein [Gluconobacter oxydans]|uniref:hypothetical protein n=1 Tax=Gluconobacter oxydans TaxID=442 RepID=UPI0039EBC843